MIIQCPKCETQYRFDDALVEGDGVWVRCSRCQHVFFHLRTMEQRLGESGEEVPSVRISDARRTPEDAPHAENGTQPGKEGTSTLSPSAAGQTVTDGEPIVNFTQEASLVGNNPGEEEKVAIRVEQMEEKPAPSKGSPPRRQKGETRHWGRIFFVTVAVLVLVAVVAGAVVMAIYPDIRGTILKGVQPYLRGIPVLEGLIPEEKKEVGVSLDSLKIKDLRQHTVTNIITGSLQVIEGVAVNEADYPVSKIKIRLVITDSYDAVVAEKVVYCGNTLTDEELGAMTDVEIQRELSNPAGSDFPAERVLSKGEIPFMVVFTQDPKAGIIKTTLTVAGADRAL